MRCFLIGVAYGAALHVRIKQPFDDKEHSLNTP
jgi:hypothetical protein